MGALNFYNRALAESSDVIFLWVFPFFKNEANFLRLVAYNG